VKYNYHVFLKKAEESLNTAKFCFEKQYYNSCVNRAYYAMFQSAAAALFKAGIRPKSKIGHDWVQAEFSKAYIQRSKRFPHLKGFLNMVQEARDIADYSNEDINKKESRTQFGQSDCVCRRYFKGDSKMTLNHVQERLINELMDYARKKYPEIRLGEITDSPSSSNHVWVIIKGIDWNDDDRVMDFIEYVAGKQEDILVEYGYPISLMPVSMPQ